MFSPDVSVHPNVASLRNPRRRQRTSSDDSIKPPKAKRQRSALRQDTFEPPYDANVNGLAGPANGDVSLNGHAPEEVPPANGGVSSKDLALRGPKKQERRGERGDGTVVLVCKYYRSLSDRSSCVELTLSFSV